MGMLNARWDFFILRLFLSRHFRNAAYAQGVQPRKQLDFAGYEGEELWRQFKIAAIRTNKTVSEWIIDVAIEKIKGKGKE